MQISAQRADLHVLSSRAEVCAFCTPQSRDRGNRQASCIRSQDHLFVIPTGVVGFRFRAALWRAGYAAEGSAFLFIPAASALWRHDKLQLQPRHIAPAAAARHKLAQPVRAGHPCAKDRERRRCATRSTQILRPPYAAHLPNSRCTLLTGVSSHGYHY